MNVRPKTVRRLALLLTLLVVAATVGFCLFAWQKSRQAAETRAFREAGLAAFERGNYPAALEGLSKYLTRQKEDPDALLAFARARLAIELPRDRHKVEAASFLARYVALRPDDPQGLYLLLEVYPQVGRFAEARDVADGLLRANPDDPAALRGKALAEASLRNYDQALKASLRVNELHPTDVEAQKLTFGLMFAARQPVERLVERSMQLVAAHPDDPRFEYLHGLSLGTAGDRKGAIEWLRKAASRTPTDQALVAELARALDDVGLYDESLTYLERTVADNPGPPLRLTLGLRLWQARRSDDVLRRLTGLDPATGDPNLLGLRALTLLQQTDDRGQSPSPEGVAIVGALSARGSPAAHTWAEGLKARFLTPDATPQARAASLRDALAHGEPNGPLRLMLGQALAAIGESDNALEAWRTAARDLPFWPLPHVLSARLLSSSGRHIAALDAAREAARRDPTNPQIAIDLARVWFAKVTVTAAPGEVDELLRLMQRIHDAYPAGGEPRTLAAYATLLTRVGRRSDAVAAITAALDAKASLSPADLSQLADADRELRLGLADRIQAALAVFPATDPDTALAQAISLHADGRTQDGLAHLVTAAAGRPDLSWQLAIARYRDIAGDSAAAKTWTALGDAHPEALDVQTAALASPSRVENRAFWLRTIDRLRDLTGDDASLWRIERARYVLTDPAMRANDRDMADVLVSLKDLIRQNSDQVEAHLLLATAYELAPEPNLAAAIEHLKITASLRPTDLAVGLRLYNLLRAHGRYEEARTRLERLADGAVTSTVSRVQVASLLADQGELTRAVELVQRIEPSERTPQASALLGSLYQRTAEPRRAAEAYERLAAETDLPADAIVQMAGFYAASGDRGRAEQVIARLRRVQLPPGQADLMLAAFEETYGSPDRAEAIYRQATDAAPQSSDAWRQLASFYLRASRAADAAAAAERGLAVSPGDAPLARLLMFTKSLPAGGADVGPLAGIVVASLADPAAGEAMQALADARSSGLTAAQTAGKLREIADRTPQSLATQAIAAQSSAAAGRATEATAIARRAMDTFPGRSDAARFAALIAAASGDPAAALTAARRWRALSLDRPFDADIAIAAAMLESSDPKSAMEQLAPHLKAVLQRPVPGSPAVRIYVAALLASGKLEIAQDLLLPLAASSRPWREMGLGLAVYIAEPAAAADWIDSIAAYVSTDATDERLAVARARHSVGVRYGDGRQLDLAAAQFALAAQADPTPQALRQLAEARRDQGDYPAAEKAYRAALAADPDDPDTLNNLAYLILLQRGDLAEARTLAQKATAAAPDAPVYLDTLGRILAAEGRHDEAIRSFDEALAARPDAVDALLGKAAVLIDLGRPAEARQAADDADRRLSRLARPQPMLARELAQVRTRLDP